MEQSKYLSHDTIHALATPVGGALAVVRMSGGRSAEILSALLGRAELGSHPPRELFRARLRSEKGDTLDDAMAVYFKGPKSHTGEDGVELYLHGGPVVAERVLIELEQLGSRQALPGEFSFRAVRNGKTSISEARAVADLISAGNEAAARLALEKMEGTQSRLIERLAEKLRKLATMGELGIDFADQDVEELSLPVLKIQVREAIAELKTLEGSFDRGEKIQFGIRTAFIGRPNAGKSSFFNALLGEERSIVSDLAGTTRDIVRERVTLRAAAATVTLRLEDTAGIRASAEDRVERAGIERSIRAAKDADLVVWVVDADATDHEWESSRAVFSEVIQAKPHRVVGVLTKKDRVDQAGLSRASARIAALGVWVLGAVDSTTGAGVSEAAKELAEACARMTSRKPGEVLLTRLDELRAVREAVTHLERALGASAEDLFAADLRQALVSLGAVIGETLPDDILGRIFSEFCIGK